MKEKGFYTISVYLYLCTHIFAGSFLKYHMDPSIENPRRNINNDNWNTLIQSAIKRSCQLQLLNLVTSDQSPLETKIISSTTPRIGKTFKYNDLESKKLTLLHETKRKIMDLAIRGRERERSNQH